MSLALARRGPAVARRRAEVPPPSGVAVYDTAVYDTAVYAPEASTVSFEAADFEPADFE